MCYKYCLLRSDVIWYIGTKMQRNKLPLSAEDGGSLFFGTLIPNYVFLCNGSYM